MRYSSLADFLNDGRSALSKGPVGLIMIEDLVEVESTIRYHQIAGFRELLVFAPVELELPPALEDQIHRVDYSVVEPGAVQTAVNTVIEAAPDLWMYYCYNGEYLFHPFCETRKVGEMLTFHAEERRDAMLCYVVDVYAGDLAEHPDAVSLDDTWMDKSGYYALSRPDPATGHPRERQLDFFGGLRWRYEEHIPKDRRKIDRIALFKAKPGLKLRPDHTFNDEEYNTYACPWHNNLTAAIISFRTAKALKLNPGSRYDIDTFRWHNSVRFKWNSQQLFDLGLMEPGQWF